MKRVKAYLMKKFSLKNRIAWGIATIIICASGLLITPSQLHAAISAGQLNDDEIQRVSSIIQEIKEYTDTIKRVTGDLFTKKTPFQHDLQKLRELRGTICATHAKITKSGSPFAQGVLGNLKGLAQHLMEAQKRWVSTLESKNLLTMGKNRGFMSARYDDTLRFILGGKNGNTRSGEGLVGYFEKANHLALKDKIQAIHKNIDFIFNYAIETKIKEIYLALHLIKNKGFTPTQIKYISWILR